MLNKNLFVAAKLHLGQLPQGQPGRARRADAMQRPDGRRLRQLQQQPRMRGGVPQEISADWISWMHRERRS